MELREANKTLLAGAVVGGVGSFEIIGHAWRAEKAPAARPGPKPFVIRTLVAMSIV